MLIVILTFIRPKKCNYIGASCSCQRNKVLMGSMFNQLNLAFVHGLHAHLPKPQKIRVIVLPPAGVPSWSFAFLLRG